VAISAFSDLSCSPRLSASAVSLWFSDHGDVVRSWRCRRSAHPSPYASTRILKRLHECIPEVSQPLLLISVISGKIWPPPSPPVIPDWRRLQGVPSQTIPDWRRFQRLNHVWRRVRSPLHSFVHFVVENIGLVLANCQLPIANC
jgi:hypothetical protein